MESTVVYTYGKKEYYLQLAPVMLCFFAMGFVDLVGIASNYIQKDFGLTDAQANLLPFFVFFWFLIFSVPTCILMNKIGRKRTVMISLLVTAISLIIPVIDYSYATMLIAFSLMGIGNSIMQTSLNPLVTNLVGGNRLASTLTCGQLIKAIASLLAPIFAAWGATTYLPTFGLRWRALFAIFAIIGIWTLTFLGATPIEEEKPDKAYGIGESLKLLSRPFILLCFLGIMCHVGIDVGTNTTAPKIIMECLGLPLVKAGFASSVYLICRTIGFFLGVFLLRIISPKLLFGISVAMMLMAMAILFICQTLIPIYIAICLIGFGNSNVFPIILSQALLYTPNEKNETSGLMIMGLIGGSVFPFAMGYAADAVGQVGAIVVMSLGVVYLMYYTLKIR